MEILLSGVRLAGFHTEDNNCLKSHTHILKDILPLLSRIIENTQTQTQKTK